MDCESDICCVSRVESYSLLPLLFAQRARRKIRMLQQDWGVESAGVRNVPSWGFSALSWGLGAPPGGCGPRLTVPPWPLDSSPFSPCADVKRLIVFAAPLEGSLMFAGPALRRVRSSSSPPCAFPCVVVITELGRHGISRRDNTDDLTSAQVSTLTPAQVFL